jgi:hypothetical protein
MKAIRTCSMYTFEKMYLVTFRNKSLCFSSKQKYLYFVIYPSPPPPCCSHLDREAADTYLPIVLTTAQQESQSDYKEFSGFVHALKRSATVYVQSSMQKE